LETVTFSFTPRPDDYSRAARLYYTRLPAVWIIVTLMGIISLLIVVFMVFFGQADNPLAWVSLCVLPLALVLLFVVWPARLAWMARRSPQMRSETTWQVDEGRIMIKNAYMEATLDWSMFGQAIESGELYLLTYSYNRRLFQVVPRRAFASPAHEDAFRALLRQHLPHKQR
jgi:hypothetical protein